VICLIKFVRLVSDCRERSSQLNYFYLYNGCSSDLVLDVEG